jgi:hypothetical protein
MEQRPKKKLNLFKQSTIVDVINLERLYGKVLLIMAKLYDNKLYNKLVNIISRTNFFRHVIGFGVLIMLFALGMVTKYSGVTIHLFAITLLGRCIFLNVEVVCPLNPFPFSLLQNVGAIH